MDNDTATHRLAAVLVLDVAGYSRLMEADENRTHQELKRHRAELIDPLISGFRARIVKNTGDGLLAEFGSAIDAVTCALAIQRGMMSRRNGSGADGIVFRAAVNVSDIIVEEDDIFGDGVNVTARLEALAEPGGICLSQATFEQVRDRILARFTDMGEHRLKNIARPVRIYGLSPADIAALPEDLVAVPRLRSVPVPRAARDVRHSSVAVLPFVSLGHDADQEYFADGIVEGIVSALSLFRNLFVIAHDTALSYRSRDIDLTRVAADLGVRFLVTGSLQRSEGRVRISARLADTETGGTLWADRFDEHISDIFALQDTITERIVTAIEPRIVFSEIERARRKPTENLDAYDLYLRALALRLALSAAANEQALALLKRALALDPNYAPALAHAAACYAAKKDQGWGILSPQEVAEGLRLAWAAIEADINDPVALCLSGHAISAFTGDFEAGAAWIDRSVKLNPNYAEGWMRSSMLRVYLNDLEKAHEFADRAMALSPLDPKIYHPLCAKGFAYFFAGRYADAARVARQALLGRQKPEMAFRILIASLAGQGAMDLAKKTTEEFLSRYPNFRISEWRSRSKFSADRRFDAMEAMLRNVGVPD
ncbi:adenylate/guanylate cyclase domain-containing protein [Microvirga thermotolerans]|uniref:Adenylate/guanylate cyclase domain-containing protein n=1 Tax=Microvirga thermotolerans TaxID=2651334 RepID=A0A5P9K0C7_9HYPH|nr:adenylate/guanylate cyclase domain-containing protein [Microvirga thermotolerans]QFU17891.1 adenylate/guanylate cyclase domain-containing protein [Microvirga thermotolerans]